MNRVPGAVDGLPCAVGNHRSVQHERFAPVREGIGPALRPPVENQFKIPGVRPERDLKCNVVGAFLLIHLRENPCIVNEIRQAGGKAVDLLRIEKGDVGKRALTGTFALDHPDDLGRGRAAFRHPVAVHVQNRHGEAHPQESALSGHLDCKSAVITGMFEKCILLRTVKQRNFH